MGQTVTLGGDRLGSGNKQKVELHNYEMTSFNLSRDFKSSMAPGVLYPFLKEIATNHGTFDIDLDTFVRTLPTVGPLFGSFKLQLDIFAVPFRLYQGILHNNPIKVGMNMEKVYLPKLRIETVFGSKGITPTVKGSDESNFQINESALEKYLGISGIGRTTGREDLTYAISRKFQCIPELAYYDIFKNYYANKQETNAYVITPGDDVRDDRPIPDGFVYNNVTYDWTEESQSDNIIPQSKTVPIKLQGNNLTNENVLVWIGSIETGNLWNEEHTIKEIRETCIKSFGPSSPGIATWLNEPNNQDLDTNIILYLTEIAAAYDRTLPADLEDIEIAFNHTINDPQYSADIALRPFTLENIDDMRNALLSSNLLGKEFILGLGGDDDWGDGNGTDGTGLPYSALFNVTEQGITWNAFKMNGLVVKTYQSDLFNNWLDTEYIDGEKGITNISSVAVVGDKFTMDSLNLAEKIYEYLNRVLVSGGTYEDWQEATYGQGAVRKAETPMYVGGMSSEVMFEEVIATTEAGADQALGSLGGKGTQVGKNGGNNIHIKCDEPCYIIGIASLTPRICYSQGNDWDRTELDTMDDLHKPALDGIGFQNLMVEQMAWWDTILQNGDVVSRSSAGKQIAWINYQTAVDKCYGDFASQKYGFMVLDRHYEREEKDNYWSGVKDITTYIDPSKFNYAFAYTNLDAQNFWVQINTKITARRKMAGKQIPNL